MLRKPVRLSEVTPPAPPAPVKLKPGPMRLSLRKVVPDPPTPAPKSKREPVPKTGKRRKDEKPRHRVLIEITQELGDKPMTGKEACEWIEGICRDIPYATTRAIRACPLDDEG